MPAIALLALWMSATGACATVALPTEPDATGTWTLADVLQGEGRALVTGEYDAGKRVGAWRAYLQDGTLVAEGPFVDGEREGDWIFYDAGGEKIAQGAFSGGEREGTWTFWPPDAGRKHLKVPYRRGEVVGQAPRPPELPGGPCERPDLEARVKAIEPFVHRCMSGRELFIRWWIDPTGGVSKVGPHPDAKPIEADTLACATRAIRALLYPAPIRGRCVMQWRFRPLNQPR